MISKLYTAAALVTAIAFASCAAKDSNDYIDKSIIPADSEKAKTQPAAPNTTAVNTAAANTPVIPGTNPVAGANTVSFTPPNGTVVNVPQPTAATTTTAPGMNPPHGQPGHRCDISVGAPLNSKPAPVATNTQPVALSAPAQQQAVTMTPVPNQTKTAPGMNPPHGEPGHRCDIAVGAPLNSKPAPANTQPVAVSTGQPQQATATTVSTTPPPPAQTKTAPGMNPPHGEPGHRCDIAVGAPLNSKPATPTVTTAPAPLISSKPDSTKN